MKYVNRVPELRNVKDPVLVPTLLDADLVGSRADGFHRFEVRRLVSSLDLIKLISGLPPSVVGKIAKIVSARSNKSKILHAGSVS